MSLCPTCYSADPRKRVPRTTVGESGFRMSDEALAEIAALSQPSGFRMSDAALAEAQALSLQNSPSPEGTRITFEQLMSLPDSASVVWEGSFSLSSPPTEVGGERIYPDPSNFPTIGDMRRWYAVRGVTFPRADLFQRASTAYPFRLPYGAGRAVVPSGTDSVLDLTRWYDNTLSAYQQSSGQPVSAPEVLESVWVPTAAPSEQLENQAPTAAPAVVVAVPAVGPAPATTATTPTAQAVSAQLAAPAGLDAYLTPTNLAIGAVAIGAMFLVSKL